VIKLLFFLSLIFSFLSYAMELSEQTGLFARGFCAGCITGIVQNTCAAPNIICTLSAHDICDQYRKDDSSRIQLVTYELPAYFLGSVCGMHMRRYIPNKLFTLARQKINPLIISIFGLNLTHEE